MPGSRYWPVILNGNVYNEADFAGNAYARNFPAALHDVVLHGASLYTGTSASAVTLGVGSKSFSTQPGKPWLPGSPLRIAAASAPTTAWMDAVVTAYDSVNGALTVTANGYSGSGSFSSWNINAGGGGYAMPGVLGQTQGGTGSNTFAGALANLGGQPLDADLTAIAALGTTDYGRSFLTLADAASARGLIGAGTFGASFLQATALSSARGLLGIAAPGSGAMCYRASGDGIGNNIATKIAWSGVNYDTHSCWSAGAPFRLTVPAGVTKVRMGAAVEWDVGPASTYRFAHILKNGAGYFGMPRQVLAASQGSSTVSPFYSMPLTVVAGQYFELEVLQGSGQSTAIIASISSGSWFGMEILG